MDANIGRMHLDRRVAMPLAAALAAGLLFAMAEAPATAQSQDAGNAASIVVDPASLPPRLPPAVRTASTAWGKPGSRVSRRPNTTTGEEGR